MATATVTFKLSDLLGTAVDPRRTRVKIRTNAPDDTVIDTAGNEIHLGSGKATIGSDGSGSFTTIIPGAGMNPESWQTYVDVDYMDADHQRGRRTRTFGPYTITANVDLADLVAQVPVPPEIPTAISLSAADARYLQQADAAANYSRKRPLDPRDHGAVCDGTTDDTAAIQAAIDAAGDYGVVELPPLAMKVSAPLVLRTGSELRGTGEKSSRLMVSTDTPVITATGGQGHVIRNLKIWHTYTGGTLSQPVIDIVNPTKPVLEDVEVDIQVQGSGIRFRRDTGLPGNAFMPMLSRVWIRQGTLTINEVTDGHFVDGFVWAHDNNSSAIRVISGHLWTFASVDVVPSDNAGTGYLFENVDGAQIIGGYCDGSYPDNPTGYGIRATNSRRIMVSGHHFFSNGRSGVQLENTNACVFTACGFHGGNKQDNSYPDINLVNSTGNTFIGTAHANPGSRTNKGGVYREDATSTSNVLDNASLDTGAGIAGYHADPFVGQKNTIGDNCRPRSLWQKHAGAPDLVFPPATLVGIGTGATWPTANAAIFHRFTVDRGAPYRYANFRCNTGSGNVQAAVVSLSGATLTDYTRVMSSGVVACTSGDKLLDMGIVFIQPGEYALVLWCDNTTANFQYLSNAGLTAMRSTAIVTGLATGVPASGSIGANWGSTAAVGGMSLGLSV